MCAIVTIIIAQTHFSSLRHVHVIGSRKNISSRTNGQVAARRVTGLIIKALPLFYIKFELTRDRLRWFVGSLVRWFVGSLVRWFVGSLVRWFVGSLVRSCAIAAFFAPYPL